MLKRGRERREDSRVNGVQGKWWIFKSCLADFREFIRNFMVHTNVA